MKKDRMKQNLIIILILKLLVACTTVDREVQIIEQALVGTWTIEHLWIDEAIELNPIMTNLITFTNKNKLSFPGAGEINWKIEKGENEQFFLDLTGLDNRYNFHLLLSFETDKNDKVLKLFLQSEKIEILSSKMLFNFDKNTKVINVLTELTTYN
jgi:hypothetical protein